MIGILAFALIYLALIWIGVAIACLIYNFAAGLVGGIEVEVEPSPARMPPTGRQ